MADTNPQDWRLPVPVRLIDVAEQARQMFGEEAAANLFGPPNLPENDYRFEAVMPGGATVTFAHNTTAAQLAAYLKREGVDLAGEQQ
ncbi:hypothetical protein [Micromonospora sp. NPDC049891]|uniref:hypothetical protein n=1 Tax=Micromonospora sp. NPDC049891 TaxID=3155655 RepID=UPI0033E63F4B